MKRVATLLAALFVLTSCQDAAGPPSADEALVLAISDGAHDGNAHFFFLPPLVRQPSFAGLFDGSLAPVVKISENGSPFAELYPTVHATDEQYQVEWHTDAFDLDASSTYRMAVLVDGYELGYADLVVGSTGAELKNVNTDEYVPLKDGRTLPIKFRIEEGALPRPEWIAFVRRVNDSEDNVFLMRPDGSMLRQLTDYVGFEWTPAISRDASRVAFSHGPDGEQRLWVVNVDGTGPRQLTSSGDAGDPTWSPADAQIVFSNVPSHQTFGVGLFKVSSDGTGLVQLTSGTDIMPAWSPDGSTIAFARNVRLPSSAYWEIFLMDPDGSNQRQITFPDHVFDFGIGFTYR
jgi:hypothetical protein